MYQQGNNGNDQERAWYAPPPRPEAAAPRRRSRSRSRSEESPQAQPQAAPQAGNDGYTNPGNSYEEYHQPAAQPSGYGNPYPGGYTQGYQQPAGYNRPAGYQQPTGYGDPNAYYQNGYQMPGGYPQPGHGQNGYPDQSAYQPQQPTYPDQSAYQPQQPTYPDQSAYQPQQPAYPAQSAYQPQQPTYPDQSAYQPQQPTYPTFQNGYVPPQQQPPKRSGAAGGNGGGPSKAKNLLIQVMALLVVAAAIVIFVVANRSNTPGQGGQNGPTVSRDEASGYATTFLPNVYVDGISLSGMTYQAGSDAVWAQANAKQNGWYVRLKNENGSYKDITADMLGISFDPTNALQQAWAIGHTPGADGQLDERQLRQDVAAAMNTEYRFTSAQQSANTSPIDTILDTLQTNAYRAPQDAVILSFNPDDFVNPFTFQQEVWGQWLDVSAVKERILTMVSTLESGEVLLEITPIAPNVTVADLQQTVTLRCRAVTPISSSSTEERTNNIRVAFSKINGKSFAHGDKFSFNKLVGRRTLENGFGEAIEYAYGEEVMGVGGGVCQASTTMYLAAIQSGMTITHRDAHSNPVNYTSLGMDATVSDTRGREVDFTFRNESGGRIFIAAHVVQSGSNGRSLLCEVRIYGPSLGDVHYKLESETVEVIPKPEEPKLKEDKNGTHVFFIDETKQASKGREGYVVDTYLCTYQGDTLISRDKVSTDTYPARQDVFWVGVNERY